MKSKIDELFDYATDRGWRGTNESAYGDTLRLHLAIDPAITLTVIFANENRVAEAYGSDYDANGAWVAVRVMGGMAGIKRHLARQR